MPSTPTLRRPPARKTDHFGTVRRRYSPDSFFLTILVFSSIALIKYALDANTQSPQILHEAAHFTRRNVGTLATTDEECRLVHQAKDKCAYISKHCPDEDPGFYSYLALYYCTLSQYKPVGFAILVSWLGLLFSTIGIAASDFFCINLSTIATILGMSESMAGVTFLAFGNGSPDVFSTFAAFSTNSSSLAIGELFGAASFIACVVAGSMALVRPFKVAKKAFVRDVVFFAVAAGFSLVFLWDGKLRLWECVGMVLFYVFYVTFVIVWHWWLGRRRKRHEKEAAARGHFLGTAAGELDGEEEYRDEEDEDSRSRQGISRRTSAEDFSALERGSVPDIKNGDDDDDEDDDELRDQFLGELNSNMRLGRTGPRSRRNTLAPVRPSLVGALEFQAVLKSLQKSREHQTFSMRARRFSDDPNYTSAQLQEQLSTTSDPASRPPYHLSTPSGDQSPEVVRPAPEVHRSTLLGRMRAGSANDAASLQADPRFLQRSSVRDERLVDISEDEDSKDTSSPSIHRSQSEHLVSQTPNLTVSAADDSLTDNPWENQFANLSPAYLVPHYKNAADRKGASPPHSPFSGSPQASPRVTPRRMPTSDLKLLRGSASSSPRSAYNEASSSPNTLPPSLFLPPPGASLDSPNADNEHDEEKPVKWWPYNILPPPGVLLNTLFPTFDHWHIKSWWERALAVVAVPSMLLLIVTLPVVEAEKDDDDDETEALAVSTPGTFPPYTDSNAQQAAGNDDTAIEDTTAPRSHTLPHINGPSGSGSAAVATNIEQSYLHTPKAQQPLPGPVKGDDISLSRQTSAKQGPHPWNRWLLITQLFLAPFFIVVVLETQYLDPPEGFQPLVKPILISLLVSALLLIPLLLTTTPTHRPKAYQPILSMAGFVVSIAWISSIASQVVAVLKALAVIMNMSHAIMGLTIFAVGNSLGDLVADITVARLGYPVMALSACFGGPMLNILLGIGLSGSYILIRGAEHRHHKHPGKEIKFRSYEIEVGETLIVSGVTLLLTLVALLIVVPLNKWMFSRRIGLCLIAVWVVSTTVNVVLEVVGIGSAGGEELGVRY